MGGGARAAALARVTTGVSAAIAVRAATPSDVDAVLAIEAVSFVDPWTDEAFHAALALPHMRFLVAEEGQGEARPGGGATPSGGARLVGYVLAMVLGPEGEIADIAVAPAERGRGTGGRLLDRACALLAGEGVERLYLEVRESNEAARRLYASRDFAPVGRRRGYYRQPTEDALVLERALTAH